MASYTIPKIGQKVKASYDAWSKCYPFPTALEHNHEIGIITEIKYSGFRLEDADYKHSDTIYTVTFPATFFEEEREVYCRYDDLIMSSARVYSGADFDGDCVTGLTGVIPTCAMTSYESPNIGCCCGNVITPVSSKVCASMPTSVLNDIFGKLLKDLDKTNVCIKETTDETLFDQFVKYAKRDAEMTMTKRLHLFDIGFGLRTIDPLIKTVRTSEKEEKTMNFRVKKIMHNGPATIVFWEDGTKTVVRLKEGDKYDPYAAFTAAVAKRLYGKNMKISEIVGRYSKDLKKIDIPEAPPRELSVEELKAAADKLGYRVSKKPKK